MWFFFSLLSAFSQATYQAMAKKFTRGLSPYFLGSGPFFAALPILLFYAVSGHWPHLNHQFYFAAAITTFLNVAATILFLKAVSNIELSLAAPILALTPVFNLFTSFIILNERPNVWGALGVMIVVLGLLIVLHKHQKKGDFEVPLKTKQEKIGLAFLFSVAAIYSISSNFDKISAQNSPMPFGSIFVSALIGLGIFLIRAAKGERGIFENKKNFMKVFLLGAAVIIASLVWYRALSGGFVVYTLTIKRLSGLIGVGYGYFLFKEKNIKQKFAGALVVLIGLGLIILFK